MRSAEFFRSLPLPRWVSAAVAICVGCVVILEFIATGVKLPDTSYLDAFSVLAVGILVALTSRWPAAGALVFLVVAIVSYAAFDPTAFPMAIVPMAALVARACTGRFCIVAGALTVVWLVVMIMVENYFWYECLLIGVLVVFGAGLGLSLRLAALRNMRLSQEVRIQEETREQAITDERKRIAGELHDVVAHDLTIIAMQARVLDTATDPEDRAEARQAIGDASRQALKDMRRMLGVLYGPDAPGAVPDGEETTGGLSLRIQEFAALLRAQGIGVKIEIPADLVLPRSLELTLIRIAQEATTNILKHAQGAPWARYVVESDERRLSLTISNAEPARRSHLEFPSSGFGLVGLRERASVYGGNIETGPIAGGWSVRATFETAAA
ncbi:sensor histidine kinase [Rothia halotolerans]|uniref:sensor histidine kinase n=1 Tax=Rothia halotolerans TaxID=405770 RepID=UPI00101C007F|nr:histidine kinase [Rothia halotolerans]